MSRRWLAPGAAWFTDIGLVVPPGSRPPPDDSEPSVALSYTWFGLLSALWRRSAMPWLNSVCPDIYTDEHCLIWPIELTKVMTDQQFQAALTGDQEIVDTLDLYERQHIRWAFVLVVWYFDNGSGRDNASHATVLVVDTVTKQFQLFDPNGNVTYPYPNMTLIINNRTVQPNLVSLCSAGGTLTIPGYAGGPMARGDPAPRSSLRAPPHVPMQGTIEDVRLRPLNPADRTTGTVEGLCALLCILVVTCCRRYQSANLWGFADAIRHMYSTWMDRPDRENFRHALLDWFRRLYKGASWRALDVRVGLQNPRYSPPQRRCLVVTQPGGLPCDKSSCVRHAYCPLHRHVLLNGGGPGGANCSEPIRRDPAVGEFPSEMRDIKRVTDVDTGARGWWVAAKPSAGAPRDQPQRDRTVDRELKRKRPSDNSKVMAHWFDDYDERHPRAAAANAAWTAANPPLPPPRPQGNKRVHFQPGQQGAWRRRCLRAS